MLTPQGRSEWLESATSARRLVPTQSAASGASLSISGIAFREAQLAFQGGLFVSTVLTAYAACELFLTMRYAIATEMQKLFQRDEQNSVVLPVTSEEWFTQIQAADSAAREIGGMRKILNGLRGAGQAISASLAGRLIELSSDRNDFAHYRPIVNGITSFSGDGSSVIASFEPSHLLDAERQEAIAMRALLVMLDLWEGPSVSFGPGPAPADWEPI